MTITEQLETAGTAADVDALAATLKGKTLDQALRSAGVAYGSSDSVARKRERLVSYYRRSFRHDAAVRMVRA